MDITSLKILNPWWADPEAIHCDQHLSKILGKPFYFNNPIKATLRLIQGTTYILRGGRQTGKTTLLKETILTATQGKIISPQYCFYLSCEAIRDVHELQTILANWLESKQGQALLICLDEISFVQEWQRALLWLINAGLLSRATTLVTGSNARDLKKSAERFPGRQVREVRIHPLSVLDYAHLVCFAGKNPVELLEIYMRVGGYPHAIRDYHEYGFVTQDTYETYANWIYGDAHYFKLNREILHHILLRLDDTVGSQITWPRLLEKTPILSHETASSYVEHLEDAFITKTLACYDPTNERAAARKARKIYFVDPLLYALAGGYLRGMANTYDWWSQYLSNKSNQGPIFETIVVNEFTRRFPCLYYWYSSTLNREVDLLVKQGDDFSLYEIKLKVQDIKPALSKSVQLITPANFVDYLATTVAQA